MGDGWLRGQGRANSTILHSALFEKIVTIVFQIFRKQPKFLSWGQEKRRQKIWQLKHSTEPIITDEIK